MFFSFIRVFLTWFVKVFQTWCALEWLELIMTIPFLFLCDITLEMAHIHRKIIRLLWSYYGSGCIVEIRALDARLVNNSLFKDVWRQHGLIFQIPFDWKVWRTIVDDFRVAKYVLFTFGQRCELLVVHNGSESTVSGIKHAIFMKLLHLCAFSLIW